MTVEANFRRSTLSTGREFNENEPSRDPKGDAILFTTGSYSKSVAVTPSSPRPTLPSFFSSQKKQIWLLFLLVVLIRLFFAWRNPGFYCGDDVESLELVLSRIQGWFYTPFDLRCVFFPFVFVFPALKLGVLLGFQDPWHLVFLGRSVVVVLSSLSIIPAYWIGRRLGRPDAAAWYSAVAVASSGVLGKFSGAVLPRGIASTVVLLGVWFALSSERSFLKVLGAGCLIGMAAALRFSELVFIPAGLVALTIERRFRHAVLFAGAACFSALLILTVSDFLFWGDPFHSSHAIVRFTLVDRLSTRGYQPWWQYLRLLLRALQPSLVFLLYFAFDKRFKSLWIWATVPIILLSFLPHKELRYLVPVLPIFLVLSGLGAFQLTRKLGAAARDRAGKLKWRLLQSFLAFSIVAQLFDGQLKRPGDGCVFAREVAQRWVGGAIACEQCWRCGGRIYFPKDAQVIDLEAPQLKLNSTEFGDIIQDPSVSYVGLKARTLDREPAGLGKLLSHGFSELHLIEPGVTRYRFFERGAPANS